VRYCWPVPGDLVHLDTKRLGRIGEGGGWRFAERSRRNRGIGAADVALTTTEHFGRTSVRPLRGRRCG
jgi:hypothetical protein